MLHTLMANRLQKTIHSMMIKSLVLESSKPDWMPGPAACGSDTEGKIIKSLESLSQENACLAQG